MKKKSKKNIDLGEKYGLWTVVSPYKDNVTYSKIKWLCNCECGVTRTVQAQT